MTRAFAILGLALLLARPAQAAPFCADSGLGPQCLYFTWASCVTAAGRPDRCLINAAEMAPAEGEKDWCVVSFGRTLCLIDSEKDCRRIATAHGAACARRQQE